ncbi:alpha/beta hydrolase family protein [Ceratobasidium sp. AG-Ba]|nr:alpha/beta hydrolase family protein [Ceratobasidium sp. AG-Ba]
MRKLPAKVSAGERLGTILTNPGGPGGSGNVYVLSTEAETLQTITEGRYDIVGFDPRGVNLTGPWPSCFDAEAKVISMSARELMNGMPYLHSSFDVDRAVVNKLSAIQTGINAACVQNGDHKMLQSVGTAFVVQDIVKISEALGEDGINFWGRSYGTALGATLAAMRPDLVKRMVLDGVFNADSYYNNIWQWGKDSMVDSHKTYTGFLSTCAEAGPEHCEFAKPPAGSNETQTTESLRKRLRAIIERLSKRPTVVGSSIVGPGIYTSSDLQQMMLVMLKSPNMWPTFMKLLSALERGDAKDLYEAIYGSLKSLTYQPYNNNIFNRSMQRYGSQESLFMILCSDTAPTNISVNSYTKYFQGIGKTSPVGETWANIIGYCNRWSFQSSQRYTGPWTTAKGLQKTRFPVLFLSLDADVVTPLSSAAKMARGFGAESASLLVQQGIMPNPSFGHCTFSHPSLCTYKHVRDYFIDGKVPANGTYCTPEPGYIYPTNGTNLKRSEPVPDEHSKRLLNMIERQKNEIPPLGRLLFGV